VYLHLLAYGGLTGATGDALLRADRHALDVLVNAAGAAAGAAVWRAGAPVFGAARSVDGTTSI